MTPPIAPPRPRTGLLLATFVLAVFCVGTAEYLVAGLLPALAADLDVSVATAGQAVTAYAVGVAVGGPLLAAAAARVPRKPLVIVLLLVFSAGTALSALTVSFPVLLAARALAGATQAPPCSRSRWSPRPRRSPPNVPRARWPWSPPV